MGIYWKLTVDDFELLGWKGEVPDHVICLFQERDRRDVTDGAGAREFVRHEYAASVGAVRDRLDVLGITAAVARQAFEEGLAEEIAWEKNHAWIEAPQVAAADRLWSLAGGNISAMVQRGVSCYDPPERAEDNPIIREILTRKDHTLFFFGDDLALVRACSDAIPDTRELRLDCTEQLASDADYEDWFRSAPQCHDEQFAAGADPRADRGQHRYPIAARSAGRALPASDRLLGDVPGSVEFLKRSALPTLSR